MSEEVLCHLRMPNQEGLYEHIKANAQYAEHMIWPEGQYKGKRLMIVGAGPSLNDHLDELKTRFAHHIWACNSALPYCMDNGVPVTHGFAIDQGEEMLLPAEWERTFDVKYLIASSVSPKLVEHLRARKRKIRWFHNYLGIAEPEGWTPPVPGMAYEMWLYRTIYTPSCQVGYGLNSVPRAICLALWMGFKEIRVYGADCAAKVDSPLMPLQSDKEAYTEWLRNLQLYADGRTAIINGENAVMSEGRIDGRIWHTRVDMVISAKHLRDLVKQFPNRITLVGDTLPNAVLDKDDAFFDQIWPRLTGNGAVAGFGVQQALTPEQETV